MAKKVPPPPDVARLDPAFNRWLLELTSILNNSGGIDPATIDGYNALQAQVAADALAITALQGAVAGQTADLAVLQAQVTILTADLAAANANITALAARAQVFQGAGAPAAGLGNVNDWYARPGAAAGSRIYIKTAVGTWTAFPF